MNEREYRQWAESAKQGALAPWDHKRGLGVIDRNGRAVHVRAGVEQTAAELSRTAVRYNKDVLDQPVYPGAENLIVFRLRGHSWTIIVDDFGNAQGLSGSLQTEVIDFAVSDTCGCIGYTLFEKGERTEYFFGSEGDGTNEFESKVRSVSRRERKDIWGLVDRFFLARDAFEPGLAYEYFFRQSGEQREPLRLIDIGAAITNDEPTIQNPGIVVVIGGEEVVSRPAFERIDFVVIQETPGKAGRISLG